MLIAICDDQQARREQWHRELAERLPDHDVQLLPDFERHYRTLNERRRVARDKRSKPDERVPLDQLPVEDDVPGLFIDDVDILVVDYDLFYFDEESYLTGAIIAYLARCYSRCKVIVGVNEFGENPFDLTLADHPQSFADVSIGEQQLHNPALWGRDRTVFRPWAWPNLIDLPERHDRRLAQIEDRLTDAVTDTVDLTDAVPLLPRSAIGLLERAGRPGVRTSLEDLARGPRLGLRRSDAALSRAAVARIAAARTAKWLESAILPLQDVLADAPHVAARNPLLLAHPEDPEAWNQTATIPATHEQTGLVHEAAEAHRYTLEHWLSRPAWRYDRLRNDSRTPGVSDPWTIKPPEYVFCEDLSRFVAPEQARRFVTELESRSPSRWIAAPSEALPALLDVDYKPSAYLAR